jgi:hypothetical protein
MSDFVGVRPVKLSEAEKGHIAVPSGSSCGCCDCPSCHMTWSAIGQVITTRQKSAVRRERSRIAAMFAGQFGGVLGQEQTQQVIDWITAGAHVDEDRPPWWNNRVAMRPNEVAFDWQMPLGAFIKAAMKASADSCHCGEPVVTADNTTDRT